MTLSSLASSTWLRTTDIVYIQGIFRMYVGISEVRIFGSRAKGTYKKNSDIDIAYTGSISPIDRAKIWHALAYEAPFLYQVDIVEYSISSIEIQEHIDRVGIGIL